MTTFKQEQRQIIQRCGWCLAFQLLPVIPDEYEFDYPLIGLCRESDSGHYGHTVANAHPSCDASTIRKGDEDDIRD